MPTKVHTAGMLFDLCGSEPRPFLLYLEGGLVSRKFISLDQRTRRLRIHNAIDGSVQRLTARQLNDPRLTNIGTAIECGAFYAEE
jgi:hypothetical protein